MKKLLLNILLSICCLNAYTQISYNLEIDQLVDRDTLYIDFLVTRTGVPFNFGNSNFVINIDTSALDLANMRKVDILDGPWDDGTDPVHYLDLGLGGASIINLSIKQITAAANPGPNVDTTIIGRVAVPIKKCSGSSNITWRIGSGVITDWDNTDIKPFATFIDPPNISLSAVLSTSFSLTSDKDTICTGNPVLFTVLPADTIYTYWFNRNWTPITFLQADTVNTYNTSGLVDGDSVWILVSIDLGGICNTPLPIDTIIMTVVQFTADLGPDTSFCDSDSIILYAGSFGAGTNFTWYSPPGNIQQGSGPVDSFIVNNSIISTGSTNTIIVEVDSAGVCLAYDTVLITALTLPVVNLSNDTAICLGATLILDAGNPGASYNWSTAEFTQTISVSSADTFWVDVTDINGCINRDSIIVTINSLPVINLGIDTAICQNDTLTLDAANPDASYNWSTSAGTQTVSVSSADTFWVDVTDTNGCINRDSIIVTIIPGPVVNLGIDTTVCDSIVLDAGAGGTAYAWQDASTGQLHTAAITGIYWVDVTNGAGCTTRDSITVTVDPSLVVNLGIDTTVCDSIVLDAGAGGTAYAWQDATTGQLHTASFSGIYWVDVTNAAGCTARDSINITVNTSPVITDLLGNDTIVCDSIEIGSTLSGGYDSYLWNTGDTVRDIFVSISGTYDIIVNNNGCNGYDTIVVIIIPPLDTPNVTGSGLSFSSVQFYWDTIPNAIAYDIMIDSNGTWTGWMSPNTPPNIHVVDSLTPSDTIYAIVRAAGVCSDTTYSNTAMAVTTTCIITYNKTPDTTTICPGDTVNIIISNISIDSISTDSFEITLDGGISWIADTTFIFTPFSDTFVVFQIRDSNDISCFSAFDTVFIFVYPLPVINLGNDTAICQGDTLTLDAGNPGASYSWSTSAASQTILVNTAVTFWVDVTDINSCINRDSIIVSINALPVVNLGLDTAICPGDTLTLDASNPGASYFWSTFEITQTISVSSVATYWVEVNDTNGCINSDSIIVTTNPLPVVNMGNDTTVCDSLALDANNIGSTWLWQDASTNQAFTATIGGLNTYWVDVTNVTNCTTRDSIDVTINSSPVIIDSLGNDTTVCDSVEIGSTLSGGYDFYLWNTGDTVRDIFADTSGTYFITVTKNGCSGSDTINITIIPPLDTAVVSDSGISFTEVQFNWDTILFVTTYAISFDSNGTWTGWIVPNTPPTTHVIDSLTPSDTVYAIVRATGVCGDTSYSDTAMAVTTTCTINYNKTADSTTICSSDSAIIIVSNINILPYQVSWDGGVSWTVDTTYTVTSDIDTIIVFQIRDSTDGACFTPFDTVFISVTPSGDTSWSGLKTSYCTSSFISILYPNDTATTGYFTGSPGLNFNGVDWYFKPQDAGAGTHNVQFIVGCDTATHTTIVQPAPCVDDVVNDSTSSAIKQPQGIFTDCLGQIYTSNNIKNTLVKIDTLGNALIIAGDTAAAGGFLNGHISVARLNGPIGLTLDPSGTVYFIDGTNHAVRMLRNDTVYTISGGCYPASCAGLVDSVPGDSAQFNKPFGICLDASLTKLYVTDQGNKRIREIELTSGTYFTTTVAGGGGTIVYSPIPALDATFGTLGLSHLIADNNYIYINDMAADAVYVYEFATDTISLFAGIIGSTGTTVGDTSVAEFDEPTGISVTCDGNVFITDKNNHSIKLIDPNIIAPNIEVFNYAGANNSFIGCGDKNFPFDSIQFCDPTALSVFVKGFIDIADFGNNKIKRLSIQDWIVFPWLGLDTSDFNYCLNEPADTLSFLYSCGGAGAFSGPPEVLTFDTLGNAIFTPDTLGIFTLSYTYTLGYCTETIYQNVSVTANPVVDLGTDTTTKCTDSLFTLDAGNPGSTYLWNTGDTTQIITADSAAIYSVFLTDINNCTATDTVEIVIKPLPFAIASSNDTMCFGDSVSMGVTPSGGTVPYTYLWSPGTIVNDSIIQNPIAYPPDTTWFFVTVFDSFGCPKTDSLLIYVKPLPLVNAGSDDTICFGDTVTIGKNMSIIGGSNPYNFSWSPGSILDDSTKQQPVAGPLFDTTTFYLTVTDSLSCRSMVDSLTVFLYPQPIADAGISDTICPGDSIIIGGSPTGSSGTTPYVYTWSPGATLDSITIANPVAVPVVTPTTYYVTITDSNNCTSAVDSVIISINNLAAEAGPFVTKCLGSSFDLGTFLPLPTATGGIPPYFYLWTPLDSTLNDSSIANPTATPDTADTLTYYVTVTDSKGCISTDSIVIQVNPLPSLLNAGIDTMLCKGDTIQIGTGMIVTGGTGTIRYLWTPNTTLDNDTSKFPNANPDSTTTYYLTVKDFYLCNSNVDSLIVTVNQLPIADAGLNDTICPGDSINIGGSLPGSGGTAPYNYSWIPGALLDSNAIANPIAIPPDSIPFTTYYLVVTDSNSCISTVDSVTISINNIAAAAGPDLFICFGDSIILGTLPIATGGVPPYSYLWSPDSTLNDSSLATPTATPAIADTVTYYVTVTDSKGCISIDSILLQANPLPSLLNAGIDTMLCTGDTVPIGTGMIISGGTIPYSFLWTPNTTLDVATNQYPNANPIITTTYYLTVSDSFFCSSSVDSLIVAVKQLPVANAGMDDTICPGDSITIGGSPSGSGGTIPYSYLWNPVALLDSSAIANPTANPPDSIPFTTYYLVVTDSNSCNSAVDSVIISINNLAADAGLDTFVCFGDSIILGTLPTATGGISPYLYNWSPGSTLNDSIIANPKATPVAVGIITYYIIVTDSMGCSYTDSIVIDVKPLPALLDAGFDTMLCKGDTIKIGSGMSVSGGTIPYSYLWTPGSTLDTATNQSPNASPGATTTYYLTVTDSFLCNSNVDSLIIVVNQLPTANAGMSDTICQGASIVIGDSIAASGGLGPYIYLWAPSGSLDSADVDNPIATPVVKTTYILIVTDSNNCISVTDSITISISNLTANAGMDNVICAGKSISIGGTSTGGNTSSPYIFSWSPASTLSNPTLENPIATPIIPSGDVTYTILVTDADGCTDTDPIIITVNPLPVANAGTNDSICIGQQVTIGGVLVTGYIYDWSPGATLDDSAIANPTTTPPDTGTIIYYLSVTDAIGCVSSNQDSVTIMIYSLPTANAGADTTIVSGVSVVIGGSPTALGKSPFTYLWTPTTDLNFSDIANPTSNPVVDITYTLTVTDDNGCSNTSLIRIRVKDTIFIPTAFTPNEDGQNDTLYVRGFGISKIDFKIYNRWGELVFETQDKTKGWGGDFLGNKKIQEMDVYMYYVKAEFTNSASINRRGRVTLLK